jgi:hypothetical protein
VPEPLPDPPPTLSTAEEKFSGFLGAQNYPKSIGWVFPGDVVIDKERRYWIRPNRAEASKRAVLRYAAGLERNLGISLFAICSNETETFASIYVPEDNLDAQYHLMGRCLKLSCPVEKCSAYVSKSRFRWLLLRLAYGKRSKGLWL